MRIRFRALLVGFAFSAVSLANAQPASPTQTVVMLPFENLSRAPGLDWIGEAFTEVLPQRLASGDLLVVDREQRMYAYERLGIPAAVKPSRATVYRMAEDMDVDQVVLGSFNFDGRTFTATAQLLDVNSLRLSPPVSESGPLLQLIEVQGALAWDLLRTFTPQLAVSRNQFVAQWPAIRLDAFESYVRGVLASDREEKIARFRNAVRLDPNYASA